MGKTAGSCLDEILLRILKEEESQSGERFGQKEIFGFLK